MLSQAPATRCARPARRQGDTPCAVDSALLRPLLSPCSPHLVHLLDARCLNSPARCGAPRVPRCMRLVCRTHTERRLCRWASRGPEPVLGPELVLTHHQSTHVGVCEQKAHGTRLWRVSGRQRSQRLTGASAASSPEAPLLRAHSASPLRSGPTDKDLRHLARHLGRGPAFSCRVRQGGGSGSHGGFCVAARRGPSRPSSTRGASYCRPVPFIAATPLGVKSCVWL